MDNQFCKSCGQANVPGSTVCTKCGQALSTAGNNPINQPNQAPNPGAQNQAPQSAAPKKSSKKFWIIGGIAAFLLLSAGLIVVAAVGGVLYFNSQSKDDVVYDYPKPDQTPKKADDDDGGDSDNPLDDINFPTSGDTDFGGGGNNGSVTDSVLVNFFETKKTRVGSYKLDNAKRMGGKGAFPGKAAGASARYVSGSKTIVHEISVYSNKDNARRDFDSFKKRERRGAKVRSNKRDQIIFAKGKLVYLAFLNPQGGIHVISSRRGPDIITYYKSYFS